MAVRKASFSDIPRLWELAQEMHAASVYAERVTPEKKAFRDLCFQTITNHGHATCIFVYEDAGEVVGFIMGTIDRVYHIAKEFLATDIFFYVAEGSTAKAAPKLLDAFVEWGEGRKNVVEIYVGISGAIGNPERTAKMYERRGFRRDGLMLVREIGLEQDH